MSAGGRCGFQKYPAAFDMVQPEDVVIDPFSLIFLAVGQTANAVVSQGDVGNDIAVTQAVIDDGDRVVSVVDGIRCGWREEFPAPFKPGSVFRQECMGAAGRGKTDFNGIAAPVLQLEGVGVYRINFVLLALDQTVDRVMPVGKDNPLSGVLGPIDPQIDQNPVFGVGIGCDIPVTQQKVVTYQGIATVQNIIAFTADKRIRP